MKFIKLTFFATILLFVSCKSDSDSGVIGAPQISVNTLLDKLDQNLQTYEPQKVGYQNVMQSETTVVFGNSDGTSVTCNNIETTIETILEVRDDAVLLHRQVDSTMGPNNPEECSTMSSLSQPVLVLTDRETREDIIEEFRKFLDSGDATLNAVNDLGNNRYQINMSTVVNSDITVDALVTVDFSVPYFMMNLESVGTARGYSNRTTSRRTGFNTNANTRGLRTRGLRTIDERSQ